MKVALLKAVCGRGYGCSVLTLERVQARLGGVCLLRYSGAVLMSPDVFVE